VTVTGSFATFASFFFFFFSSSLLLFFFDVALDKLRR